METESEFDEMLPPQYEDTSPTDDENHNPKLKRLKKSTSMEMNFDDTSSYSNSSPLNESDELEKVNEWDHDDGLDPLFGDAKQFSAKRVLDLDDNEDGFSHNDADFELGSGQNNKNNKKRTHVSAYKEELKKKKEKTKKDKSAISSIRKEKKERQAQIAQHADYQRVMRERKGVGFKPTPMVEKSISSVLEKIRQRKLEMSRKMMSSRSVEQTGCENVAATSTSIAQPLVGETTQSFRAPINATQVLFLDSERSFSQGDELNESSFPAEDIVPSAPLLNLKIDSAVPDDISSDEEESDKENIEPHPKHEFRGRSTIGDPVKAFMDEEALEDDSDNDLLHSQDKDEEGDSDMEENCDYIATDFKEKQADREKIHQLHQQWDQQQDESRTKNLLQRLKHGTKSEPSILDDDDDNDDDDDDNDKDNDEKENAEQIEDEEDESDNDVLHMPATRPTTKKLKAMIPQMFTDEDDGFVSSEDEETERMSKQCLLQKVELERQPKFWSPAEDETSREVFCRIKKLNVIPETKKKAKASSFFDALLTKGSSNNSSKSSFLRRASTHPGALSHRQGSSTGKSFIFGRDDSNSSSMSLLEDPPNLSQGQKENQVKKNSSAKFTGSQAKGSTQRTEIGGETISSTSLFDILKRSSVQTGYDDTNMADQQAVFAAFKSVKKQVKIE